MITLGIDPGIMGGWAVLDDERLVAAGDIPIAGTGTQRMVSGPLLKLALQQYGIGHAYVESVGAMPGQGVSSTFKFGRAVGVIEGIVSALDIPVTWISATKWKRVMNVTSDKETSRQAAIRAWPAQAQLFARKKDHGRAEAALIGLYGVRK